MTDALSTTFGESWQYVIALAYIYFFIVLIYSFFAPSTDNYLSGRIFVRLNRGGVFRLPTKAHKEHNYRI